MKIKATYTIIITAILAFTAIDSYAGGCSPSTTNGSCNTAVTLTPGSSCVNGTTCNGASPATSSCGLSGECAWYQFTATSTDMVVDIPVTNVPGCYIETSVYEATGPCTGTEIRCSTGAPMDDGHYLNNLTVGNTYYIQICEPQFGPCGGDAAEFCIEVRDYIPCDDCSSPCGVAQGFASAPTASTVVSGCTASDFDPLLQPGHTYTFCNSFTATATSVDFNVIITSNCGSGNVTNFSWSLYQYPSCGAAIQTGTLASLTFSGLTIGSGYAFCYTFEVPSGCTHTKHCPYFVGATPLPVTLLEFNANVVQDKVVELIWSTETEVNNDFFTVERSRDGQAYETVEIVPGAGNSSAVLRYDLTDYTPFRGASYYRLKQTDYDGNYSYSRVVPVKIAGAFDGLTVMPNPVSGNGVLSFNAKFQDNVTIEIHDLSGRKVLDKHYLTREGENKVILNTSLLTNGMYFLTLVGGEESTTIKFIKD